MTDSKGAQKPAVELQIDKENLEKIFDTKSSQKGLIILDKVMLRKEIRALAEAKNQQYLHRSPSESPSPTNGNATAPFRANGIRASPCGSFSMKSIFAIINANALRERASVYVRTAESIRIR